eukprot:scaffold3938_cov136-Skeletonema_menzelii.AAC.2
MATTRCKYLCPSWALSLGYLDVASGAVLSNWGSAVSCFYYYYCGSLGIGSLFWHHSALYSP